MCSPTFLTKHLAFPDGSKLLLIIYGSDSRAVAERGIMTYSELDLCKVIGAELLRSIKDKNDDDFIVNEENAAKFVKVEQYARDIATKKNGSVEYCNTKPSDTIGAIAIRIVGDVTFGEPITPMNEFQSAIDLCDGFLVESTGLEDASFIITFYVNDVHVLKK